MANIENALKSILKDGTKFAGKELSKLIDEAKSDTDAFVKNQGNRLERYVKELAKGEISKDEFEDLVKGLASVQKIHAAGIAADAKARAERTAKGIQSLVIDGLLKLI